jgi:hypothetical protein
MTIGLSVFDIIHAELVADILRANMTGKPTIFVEDAEKIDHGRISLIGEVRLLSHKIVCLVAIAEGLFNYRSA